MTTTAPTVQYNNFTFDDNSENFFIHVVSWKINPASLFFLVSVFIFFISNNLIADNQPKRTNKRKHIRNGYRVYLIFIVIPKV